MVRRFQRLTLGEGLEKKEDDSGPFFIQGVAASYANLVYTIWDYQGPLGGAIRDYQTLSESVGVCGLLLGWLHGHMGVLECKKSCIQFYAKRSRYSVL